MVAHGMLLFIPSYNKSHMCFFLFFFLLSITHSFIGLVSAGIVVGGMQRMSGMTEERKKNIF